MFMAKLGALLALLGTRCLIAPRLSTKRGLFGAKPSAFDAKKLAHVSRLGAQTLGQGVAHGANGNFTHPPQTEGTSIFSPRRYTPLPTKMDGMAWGAKK